MLFGTAMPELPLAEMGIQAVHLRTGFKWSLQAAVFLSIIYYALYIPFMYTTIILYKIRLSKSVIFF